MAGLQAQDPHAGRLSFRSRSRKLTAADVDRARNEERSLLRTWVMRKTVHLISTEDAGWMLPLFEPIIERWNRRRLEQLGVPAKAQEKGLALAAKLLADEGPLKRTAMSERLEAGGIALDQGSRLHMTLLTTVSGLGIQGPDAGASPTLVLRRDWIGEPPPFDRAAALAELARRYLRAFGPAGERDFARWAGLPLRDVRAGLEAIAGEMAEMKAGGETLLALGKPARLPPRGPVRMLGAFDNYALGYESRAFCASPEHPGEINTRGGGMIEPLIVRDGVLLGLWGAARKPKQIEITLDPFGPLDDDEMRQIETEAEEIGRFEGRAAMLAGG